MQKLILLDRDGVINVNLPHSVQHESDFSLLPGVGAAIRILNQAGYYLAVITNQANVGRGIITGTRLDAIHQYMHKLLEAEGAHIDKIYICPDSPPSFRRKPEPGMLLEALQDFNADPLHTPFVGDALTDMHAAYIVGCPRYLVLTGWGSKTLASKDLSKYLPITICNDLAHFVSTLKV